MRVVCGNPLNVFEEHHRAEQTAEQRQSYESHHITAHDGAARAFSPGENPEARRGCRVQFRTCQC
jgi:hypothetical protein